MKKLIALGLFLTVMATGCGIQSTAGQGNGNTGTGTTPAQTQTVADDGPKPNATPSQTEQQTTPPAQTTAPSPEQTSKDAPSSQSPGNTPQPVIANPAPGVESVTADEEVREFYDAVERQAWNEAWSIMHNTVLANPSGVLTKENFIKDQSNWKPKLVKAQTVQLLDQYKPYSVQVTLANVEVVKATFSDGTTKLVHLAVDNRNHWAMFWSPSDGIE